MNVLVVSYYIPYPPDTGASRCLYNQLKFLTAEGVTCHLYATGTDEPAARAALAPHCKTITIVPPAKKQFLNIKLPVGGSLIDLINTYIPPEPWKLFLPDERPPHAAIESIVLSEKIDMLWIDHCFVYPWIEKLKLPAALKTVIVEHNAEAELMREIYMNSLNQNIMWQRSSERKFKGTLEMERRAHQAADKVIYISSRDAGFSQASQELTVALPVIYEMPTVKKENYRSSGGRIIFTPNFGYDVNTEAFLWFYGEVFPKVISEKPSVQLIITGNAPEWIKEKCKENQSVIFTGFLSAEQLTQTLCDADVYISPLLNGSGIKFKVIEALALGLPVVATAKSLEGINVAAEHEVKVAAGSEAFADAVLQLLSDESERRRLGTAAREKISAIHSPPHAAPLWKSELEKVAKKHGADSATTLTKQPVSTR